MFAKWDARGVVSPAPQRCRIQDHAASHGGNIVCSGALFHCFQPADHRLDTRPNLLILLQQGSALRSQYVLALFEGTIFVLQLVAYGDERIDSLFEPFEFPLECCIDVFGHRRNIDTRSRRINVSPVRGVTGGSGYLPVGSFPLGSDDRASRRE